MLFLVPLLMAQAPAQAEDSIGFDVRCMLVLQMAGEDTTGDMASTLQSGMMFYFGRVDGRLGGRELEQKVLAEIGRLEGADMPALIQSCGRFMEQRGEVMMAVGERIEAFERARTTD